MNGPAFAAFLEGLRSPDLSIAVGLTELVRLADGEGNAGRAQWSAAVRDALTVVAGELGVHGVSAREDDHALDGFVEGQVLAGLEARGAVTRVGSGRAWSAVRMAPALWDEAAPRRERAIGALEDVVRRLEVERAAAYRVPESPAGAGVGGSRLRARGLTKVYRRRTVVNEVDLDVHQGEIVGLLGPNGAGKTTSFYMIVGLIPPDAGTVHLDGKDLTGVPMYRRARMGVGYLAQEPSVFRKLTVEENVLAILETLGLPRAEERRRLDELLDELGLGGLRDSKAYSLSGGERRRLEITRALVQRPKFMLLDEPFAGIDPIAVNDIQQIVRGLKARGIGAIISDHNVEQTLEIVDRAYIMYEGRIRVSGTVSELVWNDEVAEIYLGPTLTARMRGRFGRPVTV